MSSPVVAGAGFRGTLSQPTSLKRFAEALARKCSVIQETADG